MSKKDQPQRYRVTNQPHWIGGRLVYPDRGDESIVTLEEGIEPGRWLEPVEESASDKPKKASKDDDEDKEPEFAIKHNGVGVGVGNWIVERISDGSRASVVFFKADGDAKAKAEQEAERLNAGGAINLGSKDAEPSSDQVNPPAGSSAELPDA